MAFKLETLKNILVCPKCRSELIQDDSRLVCKNGDCRLAYEVVEDIPVMLVDEATELGTEEWQTVMSKLNHSGQAND